MSWDKFVGYIPLPGSNEVGYVAFPLPGDPVHEGGNVPEAIGIPDEEQIIVQNGVEEAEMMMSVTDGMASREQTPRVISDGSDMKDAFGQSIGGECLQERYIVIHNEVLIHGFAGC